MKYLKVILLAVVTIGFSQLTVAQSSKDKVKNSSAEQRASALTDAMDADLHFDESQHQKVYNVNYEIASEVEALKNSGGSKRDKFTKYKEINAKRDGKMKQVLTEDQYLRYLENKKEYRKTAQDNL